jgi:hypothetical protein
VVGGEDGVDGGGARMASTAMATGRGRHRRAVVERGRRRRAGDGGGARTASGGNALSSGLFRTAPPTPDPPKPTPLHEKLSKRSSSTKSRFIKMVDLRARFAAPTSQFAVVGIILGSSSYWVYICSGWDNFFSKLLHVSLLKPF